MQTILGSILCLGLLSSVSQAANLETVPFVDLSKFVGTWYQIARNPLFFEGNCSCSRQVLAPLADGTVSVYNSCNEGSVNGPLREIRGTAMDVDPSAHAKLVVDFGLPQKGDYWIIGLGTDYQFAIVSDPSEKSLYILSKTPTLDPAVFQTAMEMAKAKIDTSHLIITEQQGCTYP